MQDSQLTVMSRRLKPVRSRPAIIALLASGLLAGCTVVSVAVTAVDATVAVGSAAVSVATTVVSGTVKAGGAVVDAVTD